MIWRENQSELNAQKLIFIDETWAKTNMTRLRGRSLCGQPLIDKVPHGHWKTTTLIAALDYRGMRCATNVDGAVNGEMFTAFVGRVLVPTLSEGEMVVMDNLSAHKVKGVRELIESCGAKLLYLPPYSPDLNPIELAFSKIKSLMRKAKHRLVKSLWEDTQRILDQVTASNAINFFKHCGYATKI